MQILFLKGQNLKKNVPIQTIYFAQWTEMSSQMLKTEMTQNSVSEHTSRLLLLDGQLWLAVSVSGAFILAL